MIVMSCGPTTGCGKLFPINLPNCPHCGKVNFVQQYTVTVAAPPASASTESPEQQRALHPTWYETSSPTSAPEARKPLTERLLDSHIKDEVDAYQPQFRPDYRSFWQGVRFAERQHGIQHPADGAEGGKA